MTADIRKRLQALEKAIRGPRIPTKTEFIAKWGTLCDLDKTLIIHYAENLGFYTKVEPVHLEYWQTVTGYLQEMGLYDAAAGDLQSIVDEMNAESA